MTTDLRLLGVPTDFCFKIGPTEQIFRVHKQILASRSRVFATLFYGPYAESSDSKIRDEIVWTHLHPKTFENIIDYCYGNNVFAWSPTFDVADEKVPHRTELTEEVVDFVTAANFYDLRINYELLSRYKTTIHDAPQYLEMLHRIFPGDIPFTLRENVLEDYIGSMEDTGDMDDASTLLKFDPPEVVEVMRKLIVGYKGEIRRLIQMFNTFGDIKWLKLIRVSQIGLGSRQHYNYELENDLFENDEVDVQQDLSVFTDESIPFDEDVESNLTFILDVRSIKDFRHNLDCRDCCYHVLNLSGTLKRDNTIEIGLCYQNKHDGGMKSFIKRSRFCSVDIKGKSHLYLTITKYKKKEDSFKDYTYMTVYIIDAYIRDL